MKSLPDAASANVQTGETAEPDLLQNNPMLGISLKVASVAVFVGMSTLLKAADGIPLGQLIFFRSFSQSLPSWSTLRCAGSYPAFFKPAMGSAISGAAWSALARCL